MKKTLLTAMTLLSLTATTYAQQDLAASLDNSQAGTTISSDPRLKL